MKRHRFLDPEFRKRPAKLFLERVVPFLWRVVVVSGNGRTLEVAYRVGKKRAQMAAFIIGEDYGANFVEDKPRRRPTKKADRGRQLRLIS